MERPILHMFLFHPTFVNLKRFALVVIHYITYLACKCEGSSSSIAYYLPILHTFLQTWDNKRDVSIVSPHFVMMLFEDSCFSK